MVTAGLVVDRLKIEASRFNGREPDEHRYDIETGKLDSTAVRISFNPTAELREQLRALDQERLALTKARRRAEISVHNAGLRLDGLGALRRGRRKNRLIAETASSRAAIRLADERLKTLAREMRDLRTDAYKRAQSLHSGVEHAPRSLEPVPAGRTMEV